jgi:hypothetical protein
VRQRITIAIEIEIDRAHALEDVRAIVRRTRIAALRAGADEARELPRPRAPRRRP